MTREEALDWLFKHLHPVIRANGCKQYKEYGGELQIGCKLCSEQQKELMEVKKILSFDELMRRNMMYYTLNETKDD